MAHAAAGHSEHRTNLDTDSRKVAMWTLIGSECFLFGTLIANYFISRTNHGDGPKATDIYNIDLTTFSTFILLMSSVAMVLALHACELKQLRKFQAWLGVVVVGGIIFLGCQVYEFQHFYHVGLGFSTSVFATSFYMLTGCHGLHVAVGVLWMTSILITSLIRGDSWFNRELVEVAGLYWHFVDVVWIIIFTVVYLFVYF
jgi:heme/copper-type cytochrome/quinol oxidase subunit 3